MVRADYLRADAPPARSDGGVGSAAWHWRDGRSMQRSSGGPPMSHSSQTRCTYLRRCEVHKSWVERFKGNDARLSWPKRRGFGRSNSSSRGLYQCSAGNPQSDGGRPDCPPASARSNRSSPRASEASGRHQAPCKTSSSSQRVPQQPHAIVQRDRGLCFKATPRAWSLSLAASGPQGVTQYAVMTWL
ncbi:hypothetical protein D3C87_1009210 [compost metagenome]